MGRYILERTLQSIVAAFGVVTLLFVLLRMSGDPAAFILGPQATPAQIHEMRETLGLNEPLLVQYGHFVHGVARLDFGESFYYRKGSMQIVFRRIPATLLLLGAGMLVALMVGVPIGVFAALRRGKFSGTVLSQFALVGQSMPSFWSAILSILLFSVVLGWLPSFGFKSPESIVLPAVSLGLFPMAKIMRLVRSGVLETLGEDYVRTAYAKGLPSQIVITRHILRNALIPIITVVGMDMGQLMGGAIVTEIVFSWPGMGRLMVEGVRARDLPLVQAAVFVIAVWVLLMNFMVDIVYGYVDPRLRHRPESSGA